ncbi:UNVERIFIED_CONTAM: hypothetical protein K2H54_050816 [Gekko kuhli]
MIVLNLFSDDGLFCTYWNVFNLFLLPLLTDFKSAFKKNTHCDVPTCVNHQKISEVSKICHLYSWNLMKYVTIACFVHVLLAFPLLYKKYQETLCDYLPRN